MKAVVIDNEKNVREAVVALIKHHCKAINHIAQASGVMDGLEKISNEQPDIVFLDVEMDDGTGFDLIRMISNINFQLVFITAHDKYALEAFRFSAVDYLVKPIDAELLVESVEKAKTRLQGSQLQKQLNNLMDMFTHPQDEAKIVLRDNAAIYFVKVKDIIRCESEGAYTQFFLTTGEKIMISKTIKEFDEMLTPKGFVRTHQSHLVAIEKIKRYDRATDSVILENKEIIPVSQRKKEEFLSLFK
jgi:two-component system, LytTR family, response regulator